jgi:hypothetical protein
MKAIAVLVLLILATGFAFYVVWMNRESEKIITAVVPISVAALIGVLLSVFLFGGEPVITAKFPAAFLFRISDRNPLNVPDRPMLLSLFEVPTLRQERPDLMEDGDNGATLYHHFLQKAIIDAFASRYSTTWEIETFDFKTGMGEQQTSGAAADATEPSTKITTAEIAALLKGNRFAGVDFLTTPQIALPPGSALKIRPPGTTKGGTLEAEISIKNDFVSLTIKTAHTSWLRSLGGYRPLMGFSWEQDREFATAQYFVSIQAKFDRWRPGHPKMPKYKRWVNQIVSDLRARFDEQVLWSETRQNYVFRKQLEQFSGAAIITPAPFLAPMPKK